MTTVTTPFETAVRHSLPVDSLTSESHRHGRRTIGLYDHWHGVSVGTAGVALAVHVRIPLVDFAEIRSSE
jgi:hypothetical protein